MKIASKYAHEAAGTTKSPVKDNLKRPANNDVNSRDKKKVKSVDESEPDLLGEQDRLIKEMKEKEKANRLLKENYFHFSIRYFFSSYNLVTELIEISGREGDIRLFITLVPKVL